MEAFVLERYGSKVDLQRQDVAEPEVGPYDVLVQVSAASVNPLDVKIKAGLLRMVLPYRRPFVMGHDLAGVVVRVGSAVESFVPGDEVFARPDDGRIGTFAELIAVPESDLALKPTSLSMEESAAVPLVALTAWQALVDTANVQPGHKVLIHAGSGGIGTIAIQLAKHLGAHVAATTGTSNVSWVKDLGADVVVDYRKDDFASVLRDYDVVIDGLGGRILRKSFSVLRPGGIAIGIYWPPDPEFVRSMGGNPLMRLGTELISAPTRLNALRHGVRYSYLVMRADGEQLKQIAALVDQGVITPVLDKTFAFQETNDAIRHVHSGRAKGKVVISMGAQPQESQP